MHRLEYLVSKKKKKISLLFSISSFYVKLNALFHQIWINPLRCIRYGSIHSAASDMDQSAQLHRWQKECQRKSYFFYLFKSCFAQVMFCTRLGNKIGFLKTSEINEAKLTLSRYISTKFKETVRVIATNPWCKEGIALFITVPSKHWCVRGVQRYLCVSLSKPGCSQLKIQCTLLC